MKGRDILKSMVDTAQSSAASGDGALAQRSSSGAVRAMNLSLGKLSEEAAAAKTLRASIAAGDHVVDLDAALIDVSFIRDRIPADVDPEFDRLKDAIRLSGQQVPILVRPHPQDSRRYQAAYGHRRLRAAFELGLPVKAIVRKLSDTDVLLAQGQENGTRVDLSFIERALFAHRMHASDFGRETIAAALGVDLPETSRLLQVAQSVDTALIMAIGPAPKVGRPRWLALADRLKDPSAKRLASAAAESEPFLGCDTNGRFELVLKAVNEPERKSDGEKTLLRSKSGRKLGSFEETGKGGKLILSNRDFSAFLQRKLPLLVAEFNSET